MPSEIDKKVSDWINTQGYPFEMTVERAFQKAGFSTSISDYYEDFDSGKFREIDISAYAVSSVDERFVTQVAYKIECKYSKEKPWVIFTRNRPYNKSPFLYLFQSKYSNYLLSQMGDYCGEFNNHQFSNSERIGYGIVQGLKNSKDDTEDLAYKACHSAFKAALFHSKLVSQGKQFLQGKIFTSIVVPVVVVDAPLYESFLLENGSVEIKEIEYAVLDWKQQSYIVGPKHIHIVTRTALDKFVQMALSYSQIFLQQTDLHKLKLSHVYQIEANKNKRRVISPGIKP